MSRRKERLNALIKKDVESKPSPKTNAARASHPSRIVVTDILAAVFRLSERTSRTGAHESAQSSDVRRGLHLGPPVQRVHPALEGRISLEAATPGHQFTEVNRISPGDSPSRNHRQR
jgi:hypothetical protein